MSDKQKADKKKIVIAGAGTIGCYVGGLLAAAGHSVTLLGRARLMDQLGEFGLHVSDYTGLKRTAPPENYMLATDPAVLSDAEVICVCVKAGATADIAALIAEHAPSSAIVISLQNGLKSVDTLREGVGARVRGVLAGMVPYNVVQLGEGKFHRGTSGDIIIEDSVPGLANILTSASLPIQETDDIMAVQWGKLVVNLNNANNALSNLPLRDQLANSGWRRLVADQMTEALTVLKAAGISIRPALPVPTEKFVRVMRIPNPFFRLVAGRMLKVDPSARSSMWDDLQAGRMTEIDELQGAIVALGNKVGIPTPLNARVADCIRRAQEAKAGSPAMTPEDVRAGA